MSMIKAVDKLREWANDRLDGYAHADAMRLADEIEAEIGERYMPLPLDADGVPIHVGDKLTFDMNDPGICTGYDWLKSDGKWMIVVRRDWHNGCVFLAHDKAHHVKPRTLEDVLFEFGEEFEGEMDEITPVIAKYAEEIRAMFGEVER